MPAVKIKDIRLGMRNLTVIGKVVSKEITPRSPDKPHATAILQDETGNMPLSLWREQVDQVSVGDIVRVDGGFVYLYRGNLELNTWNPIQVMQRTHVTQR